MKNKGYTLVELLAVIIILSVIILITTPTVLKTVNKARKEANNISVKSYIKAVEQTYIKENINKNFDPNMCEIQSNGNLICNDSNEEIKIDAEGSRPTSGTILMYEGKVLDASIINFSDKKYLYKDNEAIEIKEQEDYEFIWIDMWNQDDVNEHYRLNKEKCLEKWETGLQYYCEFDAYQYTLLFGFNNGIIEKIKEPSKTVLYGSTNSELQDVVVIPESVVETGDNYGEYKIKTKTLILPSALSIISESFFHGSNIETLFIPNTVTMIGSSAFQKNNLKSIVIPGSIKEIPDLSFAHNKLETVVIMEGVESITGSAFSNNNLTEITIPSTVTYIGGHVFSNNKIESVTIKNSPENVEIVSCDFGWREGSKCALWTGDIKENPCIHWEY